MTTQAELFTRLGALVQSATTELEAADNDRAMILLGAALVDQCLTLTLEMFLSECHETEKLLDPMANGPLSTFVAKTRLCVSLGLLPAGDAKCCLEIAKIRNTFAHQVEATFSKANISSLEDIEKFLSVGAAPSLSLGGRFQQCCSVLSSWIALRWTTERLAARRKVHSGEWSPPQ